MSGAEREFRGLALLSTAIALRCIPAVPVRGSDVALRTCQCAGGAKTESQLRWQLSIHMMEGRAAIARRVAPPNYDGKRRLPRPEDPGVG